MSFTVNESKSPRHTAREIGNLLYRELKRGGIRLLA
jgi:hypothetical protein